MAKKTQPPGDKSPEEIAQAFMQLWQEKWHETLRQKGWPQDAAVPPLGQMPFFNPFMPMNNFAAPAAPENGTIRKLEARITALEKRLKAPAAPKTVKKAATAKKPRKTK